MRFLSTFIYVLLAILLVCLVPIFATHYSFAPLQMAGCFIPYALAAACIILIYINPKAINGFAVPAAFLVSPILVYMLMVGLRSVLSVGSCPAGWEMLTMYIAFLSLWPCVIITLIPAIIRFAINKRKAV